MEKRKSLKDLLAQIKKEMSGYILAYDPRGESHYACRAWFAEYGPWFHGYGDTEEEAAQNCLDQILDFKKGVE